MSIYIVALYYYNHEQCPRNRLQRIGRNTPDVEVGCHQLPEFLHVEGKIYRSICYSHLFRKTVTMVHCRKCSTLWNKNSNRYFRTYCVNRSGTTSKKRKSSSIRKTWSRYCNIRLFTTICA